MKKSKIIIFGASGQIGIDLVYYFSNYLYEVICVSTRQEPQKFKKIRNIKWYNLKFKNYRRINMKSVKFAINCTGIHSFSKFNQLDDYIDTNILIVNEIIKIIKNKSFKRLYQLSTISKYDMDKQIIIDENSKLSFNSNYSITKTISDAIIQNSEQDYVIIHLPGVLTNNKNYVRPLIKTIIKSLLTNEKINIYNSNSKFNAIIDTYEIFKFIQFTFEIEDGIRSNFILSANRPMIFKKLILRSKILLKSKSVIKSIKSNKNNDDHVIKVCKLEKYFTYKLPTTKVILDRYINDNY